MLLFLHGTITDLIACVAALSVSVYWRISYLYKALISENQMVCIAIWLPVDISKACTSRFALIIVIDRLLSYWYLEKWYSWSKSYRYVLISIAWLSTLFQECGWLLFIDLNNCVSMCFDYISHPDDAFLRSVVDTVCDIMVVISVVVIYFSLPIITTVKLRSENHSSVIMRNNSYFDREQILSRVKLLSVIMLPCFICTMFIGTVFCDFINYFSMISLNVETVVFVIAYVSANLTSVIIPYVYLMDKSFRTEALKLVRKLL